jgi:hypothetical protein
LLKLAGTAGTTPKVVLNYKKSAVLLLDGKTICRAHRIKPAGKLANGAAPWDYAAPR